jgi:hypothetical protein
MGREERAMSSAVGKITFQAYRDEGWIKTEKEIAPFF